MPVHKSKINDTATVFAALGDPNRLAMVIRLCGDGPLPTVRLKEATNFSRQAVTKHLSLLEKCGLLTSERAGRDRLWKVQPHRLEETRKYLDKISAEWDSTLKRLQRFVEEGGR